MGDGWDCLRAQVSGVELSGILRLWCGTFLNM